MNEDMERRLEVLKIQQKQKEHLARIAMEKQRLISEINAFYMHYRFATDEETNRINAFINKLPTISPTRLDLSKLAVEQEFPDIEPLMQYNNPIWICCICGSTELINLFSNGSMKNFINDFTDWYDISNFLLLLFDNMIDFIYIDDDKNIVKSQNGVKRKAVIEL